MMRYHLIVSSPPHAAEADAFSASAVLGLAAAEFRMRANYPVPEVWFADVSPEDVKARADVLTTAGYNVVVVDTAEFATLPPPDAVRSFSFTSQSLVWDLGEDELETPFNLSLFVIHGRPKMSINYFNSSGPGPIGSGARAGARKSSALGMAMRFGAVGAMAYTLAQTINDREAAQTPATTGASDQAGGFLDLYFRSAQGIARVLVTQQGTDFTGLAQQMKRTAQENLKTLLDVLLAASGDIRLDERLLDVTPRSTTVLGVGLQKILESLQGGGGLVDHLDLSSRLIYLTSTP